MTLIGLTGGVPRYDPYAALAGKLALAIDWRRSDLVTAGSGLASQVLDVIGGRAFVQASGSLQPGYVPPGGFSFDGIDDTMAYSGSTGMPSGASAWEFVGIFDDQFVGAGEKFAFSWGSSGGVNTSVHIGSTGGVGTRRYRLSIGTGTARVSIGDTAVFSNTGPHVVHAWYDGTTGHLSVDGNAAASSAVAQNLSTGRARMSGQSSAASNPWSGPSHLKLGFNALLTADERTELISHVVYLKDAL